MLSKTAMGVASLAFASAVVAASAAGQGRGAYAQVNGIRMYYETYGPERGVPLVLLHGGGSTIDVTFGRILPFLAHDRRVIAIEEQAHGRTSDRDAPLSFATSADDVAALLGHLHIEQADVFGFSNGASVGMAGRDSPSPGCAQTRFRVVDDEEAGRAAAAVELIQSADISNMPQPLKDAFLKVNPDPAKLKTMHDKDAERMRHFRMCRTQTCARFVRRP